MIELIFYDWHDKVLPHLWAGPLQTIGGLKNSGRSDHRKMRNAFVSEFFILKLVRIWSLRGINARLTNKLTSKLVLNIRF